MCWKRLPLIPVRLFLYEGFLLDIHCILSPHHLVALITKTNYINVNVLRAFTFSPKIKLEVFFLTAITKTKLIFSLYSNNKAKLRSQRHYQNDAALKHIALSM